MRPPAPAPSGARPTLETAFRAAREFGPVAGTAEPDGLRLVNAGVNTVYRSGDMALRMVSETQKDRNYLTPPLDWLRHLHAAGAWVCEPLPTLGGSWIASVTQDSAFRTSIGQSSEAQSSEGRHPETFLATAVRWADGPRLSQLPPTPALYRAYGRSIGRLHRASQGYTPSPSAPPMLGVGEGGVFPRWDGLWQRAAQHVCGFPALERAFERLTPAVLAWSAEESVMTHGDLRPGNVIWQRGRAVLIDFDEPVLGPAALDLARAGLELNAGHRPALRAALLEGYRLEWPLDAVWDARMVTLTAARAALMAAWSAEDGQAEAMEDGQPEATAPTSGSGAVVGFHRLLDRLDHWDF